MLRGCGLEQRKQRAHGLADAGGRLGQQTAARCGGLVHRLRQGALPLAKVAERKRQRCEGLIARCAVGTLGFGPGQKSLALGFKVQQQIGSAVPLGEHCLLLCADIEIHQSDVDMAPPLLLAQQPAVDARLRPVQQAVRRRLAVEPSFKGLHLVESLQHRVKAIGAAPHMQCFVMPRQGDFCAVAWGSA